MCHGKICAMPDNVAEGVTSTTLIYNFPQKHPPKIQALWRTETTYIVSSFDYHVEEMFLSSKEWQWPAQEDKGHDPTAPDVNRFAVRLTFYDLRGHEVRCPDAT